MSLPFYRLHALLLTLILTAPALAEEDLLATLRPEHPRLLGTAEDFEQLQIRRADDPQLDETLNRLVQSAERQLDAPLLERKLKGKRLLGVSRAALGRITQTAMAYRITGDKRFAERAEREMLNVCEFEDWNPSHFLDVAEMAAAVGLGYDWLYDALPEDSRVRIREGLRDKAVGLIGNDYSWKRATNNWNSVCYGGMTLAALAIAEDEPELARQVLAAAKQNNPRTLAEYEPNGVYPEGPGYWSYGTAYQALLVSALRTAVGDDLGLSPPAFVASGAFITHATGPTGKAFNFSDGGDSVGAPPVLYWIAREGNTPGWVDATARFTSKPGEERVSAVLPLWMTAAAGSAKPLPLSWHGRGHQPVAMFRTSWTDPNAMYLAAKGGRASLNHGHMDVGTFVFDADGVRWAIDMGGVNYNTYEQKGISIWNRSQGGQRWKVFRYCNLAHNTLTVDGAQHNVDGNAPITQFTPLVKDRGGVEIDLSEALPGVDQAIRRFVFDAEGRQVMVTDQLAGLQPGAEIRWTMITEAETTIDGQHVTLTQDGKQLNLAMHCTTPGTWNVAPYAPPEGFFGETMPGVSILTWNAEAPANGTCEWKVTLKPGAAGE